MGGNPPPKMFAAPGAFGSSNAVGVVTESTPQQGAVAAGPYVELPPPPPPPAPPVSSIQPPKPKPLWQRPDRRGRGFYGGYGRYGMLEDV